MYTAKICTSNTRIISIYHTRPYLRSITTTANKNNKSKKNKNNTENVDLSEIESKLHIHKLEDWYNVPKVHLRYADKTILNKYESVEALVRAAYPSHAWSHDQFFQNLHRLKSTLTPQSFLARILHTIFIGERKGSLNSDNGSGVTKDNVDGEGKKELKIITNARSSLGMIGACNYPLELDLYLPELRLGFEYQDEHHYFHNIYGISTLGEYQERDRIKLEKAAENGIAIILVPFWWDWNVDSLVATIKSVRPDVLPDWKVKEGVQPFSQTPPPNIQNKFNYEIPGLGVPMLAMQSPQSRLFDPTSWWVFEKYDGIRAVWHPELRILYSRWAKPLRFPHYFLDLLPSNLWLDGEIWFGRERGARYEAIKAAVTTSLHNVNWEKMQYVIFDCPDPGIRSTSTYEDRYSLLKREVPENNPMVSLVTYEVCTGRDFVEDKFYEIRTRDGEGIIIRDPYAFYMSGYSRFIYKHKGFNDAEALVIRKLSDERYLCRVNKMQIKHNTSAESNESKEGDINENDKLEDNREDGDFYEIEMTLDDKLYEGDLKDIQEGGFVSFRYIKSASAYPTSPKIYAARSDIHNWEQVMVSKRKPPAHKKIWKPVLQANDWTVKANRRQFLDTFAHARGFDPLVAENWYSIDNTDIRSQSGNMLDYYNNSHTKALLDLYPDIGLKLSGFARMPMNYWNEETRKNFFDSIAASNNFDPLVAANWYAFSNSDITKIKGGYTLLKHHKGSIYNALTATYPFTEFDKEQFTAVRYNEKANRESFLRAFAQSRGFDPLIPDNWYNISTTDIIKNKGGSTVLSYYNASISRAVADIFPDIGLQRHLFVNLPIGFHKDMNNQRMFFDEFAKSHNFDPLIANNWRTYADTDIIKVKNGKSILNVYSGKLGAALTTVYGFDPPLVYEKETRPKHRKWTSKLVRRQFFDGLAKKKGFDPLVADNWYPVNYSDIQGASALMAYYKELKDAIMDAYPDVKFDENKFHKFTPRDYWLDMKNRKKHFDEYAKSKGFDPLIAENWYHLTSWEIKKLKWGRGLLEYYRASVPRALIDIYKDIGLDINKFRTARMFRI